MKKRPPEPSAESLERNNAEHIKYLLAMVKILRCDIEQYVIRIEYLEAMKRDYSVMKREVKELTTRIEILSKRYRSGEDA